MNTLLALFLRLLAPQAHAWLAPSPRPALGLQAMGARREHCRRLEMAMRGGK